MRQLLLLTLGPAIGACAGASVPPPPTALNLTGPVVPLAAPVEMPRQGWGPFARFCNHMIVEAEPPLQAPSRTARSCIAMRAEPLGGGSWRVTAYPAGGSAEALNISMVRRADGTVSDLVPGGSALRQASEAERRELDQYMRDLVSGAGSSRRTLTQGSTFTSTARLPPGFTGTLTATCTVQGTAGLAGRQVIVADCSGATPTSMAPNRDGVRFRGEVSMRGPAAIDVESGVIAAMVTTMRLAGVFSSDVTGRSANGAFRARVAGGFE
ncbi:MAG: hypothetical protein IT556_07830 [Acetobacteraceae bacterium]|nr:hypothetical protein [Acetobacteraceae bacterium]